MAEAGEGAEDGSDEAMMTTDEQRARDTWAWVDRISPYRLWIAWCGIIFALAALVISALDLLDVIGVS